MLEGIEGADAAAHWGLIGQDAAVTGLARALAEDRLAHAYLFTGPAQSGKATLARRLAQALTCENPIRASGTLSPCLSCRACRQVEEGKHPDVETVAPGGLCAEREHDHRTDGSKDIKICQVRALERRLNLRPFEASRRVVAIDPADMLNTYAADAFLKTLEEPPADVELVLITTREETLLETVRSRLRRIELRAVPVASLSAALEERGADSETAALVARLSRGCAGWALDAVAHPDVLEKRAVLLDELSALGSAPRYERFAFAAELATRWSRDRRAVLDLLCTWTDWWRDVLLAAAGSERGILNGDRIDGIRAAAAATGVREAARAVQALRDVQGQLEENANPRLALEVLMLRLPDPAPVRA
jgi:DNA polymerase-3 subunit delta'